MKTRLIPIALLTSQIHLLAAGAQPSAADYVAHEWGTFTSVQGADGQLIQWQPLVTSKLPGFVYDRSRPWGDSRRDYGGGKAAMFALQRMETPVIYFYADREVTADVTIHFPKGVVTEWYPYAGRVGPSWVRGDSASSGINPSMSPVSVELPFLLPDFNPKKNDPVSVIRWPNVRVLPSGDGGVPGSVLPKDASGSHYYAARETDANVIEVTGRDGASKRAQHEKFLFYRGVGSFETPLQVTSSGPNAERLTLQNRGDGELSCVVALKVQGNEAAMWRLERLGEGEHKTLELDWAARKQPLDTLVKALGSTLCQALEAQGLFAREASAMVETWRDSWLEEQGLRVLYILPREWTDQTLPLSISPQPRQLARVMVGRAEVITPRVEEEVQKQITRFADPDPKISARAIADFRDLRLGRFAEPAIRRATGRLKAKSLQDAGWRLLQAAAVDERKAGSLAGL